MYIYIYYRQCLWANQRIVLHGIAVSFCLSFMYNQIKQLFICLLTIRVFPLWIAHRTFWGAHLSSVDLWELIMYYRLLDLSLVICFVNISSRLVAFTQLVVFQQTELINFNIVKFIHLFLHGLCLFCLD